MSKRNPKEKTHARTHTHHHGPHPTRVSPSPGAGKTTLSVEREERATHSRSSLACLLATYKFELRADKTYAEGPGFSLNEHNESALGGVGPGIRGLGRRQGDVEAECPGDI